MLFQSPEFLLFFPTVYTLYWLLLRRPGAQNFVLLVASYVFYGFWDWRFLGLLLTSTATAYLVAPAIVHSGSRVARRRWLWLALGIDLGLLGLFKYYGFFADSLVALTGAFGLELGFVELRIILPVGISFYTFQSMSYTIDVYRGRLAPVTSFRDFALYVSFFPQLVAGPIERAGRLLPQIQRSRDPSSTASATGLFLVLWGYFQKVVVADNVAVVADRVFGSWATHHGVDLLIGLLAFTVQVYADFSGYSDIARGLALLLGFDLIVNFRLPYFASRPSEIWERWHISLSTWIRDYVYIPLGGSRGGDLRTAINLLVAMSLGGLWHGARWGCVLWGTFHALVVIGERLLCRAVAMDHLGGRLARLARTLCTFGVFVVGLLIFRSTSWTQFRHFLAEGGLAASAHSAELAWTVVFFTLPLLLMNLTQHRHGDLLAPLRWARMPRVALQAGLILATLVFRRVHPVEFFYFQF